MSFVQLEFLWFLSIVLVLYWGFPRRRWQNVLLAVASAVFYGWVHPWFLLLLYGSAVLDYNVGRAIVSRPERKRLWLTLSLVGNLGMLGYFKYCDFFIENVVAALSALGLETSMHTLGIFLPVGISFYTFQTMSYTIDIYRGTLKPRNDFLDYVVFVSFFPQLVAGPVERASRLLPQVEQDRHFRPEVFASGVSLAMWGGFKKMVVADTVAPYVDKIMLTNEPSGAMIAAATLGFAIQILADFSGYTDMARGLARMLGFELMENFKNPYLAVNPSDFWRRWHVSFSSWIRDYLYIPLGGSRGGRWSTLKATFGAMLLSGLWHGASWNFVLWGAFHAALITGYRAVTRRIPRELRKDPRHLVLTVPLMFGFTCLGWLIFRETRIERLLYYATLNPFEGTTEQWVATTTMLSICALTATPLVVGLLVEKLVIPRISDRPWYLPLRTTAWAFMALGMLLFFRLSTLDFIYFQF
jgi:D-alanyl-lipoteichoic acid acyltransferase DltB (MBOAT superfamily)